MNNVVQMKPREQEKLPAGMSRILEALAAPPEPAMEVVGLERAAVEKILADLEAGDPIALTANGRLVPYLRAVLAEPKCELWAIHSAGAGASPMLSREHAEETAKATQERCQEIAQKNHWEEFHVEVNVIPSHLEPAEHFEELAQTLVDQDKRIRAACIRYHEQRDDLMVALSALLDENDTTPAAILAKQLLDKITKESA